MLFGAGIPSGNPWSGTVLVYQFANVWEATGWPAGWTYSGGPAIGIGQLAVDVNYDGIGRITFSLTPYEGHAGGTITRSFSAPNAVSLTNPSSFAEGATSIQWVADAELTNGVEMYLDNVTITFN